MSTHIALVTCSTRKPRLNPSITEYVHRVLKPKVPTDVTLDIIDIADQGLPLYDEPTIPSTLPVDDPTPHYVHEHARAWSAKVRKYDAFIFVTPQYNWSVPASLKNALDYLFHEWTGKPAAVVSYGGHGGGKSAAHLKNIFGGLHMRAISTAPAISISKQTMVKVEVTEAQLEAWKQTDIERVILQMFEEMLNELEAVKDEKKEPK